MVRLHYDDPTADWTTPGVYEVDAGHVLPRITPSVGFEQNAAPAAPIRPRRDVALCQGLT